MQSKYFAKRTARNGLLVATALACLNAAPAGALAGDMVSVPSDAALAPRGATLLGTTPASQTITVAVTLPGRDPAGARAFVAALGTPGNALFHHCGKDQENDAEDDDANPPSNTGGYVAHVRLDQNTMNVDGTVERLKPGMAITAEIKTGQQTVISYLLSPLSQSLSNAGHEK